MSEGRIFPKYAKKLVIFDIFSFWYRTYHVGGNDSLRPLNQGYENVCLPGNDISDERSHDPPCRRWRRPRCTRRRSPPLSRWDEWRRRRLSDADLLSISLMFYKQLLWAQIPKAQKRQSSQQGAFGISTRVKVARKMLIKSTFVVNFINVLQATFAPVDLCLSYWCSCRIELTA